MVIFEHRRHGFKVFMQKQDEIFWRIIQADCKKRNCIWHIENGVPVWPKNCKLKCYLKLVAKHGMET